MRKKFFLIYLICPICIFGQQFNGFVSSEQGRPLENVSIQLNQEQLKKTTNKEGNFSISIQKLPFQIRFSKKGYETFTDSIYLNDLSNNYTVRLNEIITEIEEVKIEGKSDRERGKEIIKEVIKKRALFEKQQANYSCELYALSYLESPITSLINKRKAELRNDTLVFTKFLDSITKAFPNNYFIESVLEWKSTSFKEGKQYKDIYDGYLDYSQQGKIYYRENGTGTSANFGGTESIIPAIATTINPYIFNKSLRNSDFPLFNNIIDQGFCQKPIISPVAYNAFLYYRFYLQNVINLKSDSIIYQIRVEPLFKQEALVSGFLYVNDKNWEIVSADLKINSSELLFFSEMHIALNYKNYQGRFMPENAEYHYKIITATGEEKKGSSIVTYSNYTFSETEKPNYFWNEQQIYDTLSKEQPLSYWNQFRTNSMPPSIIRYIHAQDSIKKHHQSEPYLIQRDSIFNAISIWDATLSGFGFRNTYKKRSLWLSPLINQLVPFGVGGYRHRLAVVYTKGFKNGKSIDIEPTIDYGFLNKDLKGELGLGFLYNPLKASKIVLLVGDSYDFINSYQSVIGTLGPSNRVRNQKIQLSHRTELSNGLYAKISLLISNRISIDSMKYPSWVNQFGMFAKPLPFDGYAISVGNLELEYSHNQKYLIQENKKIVLGSKWPLIAIKYSIGMPILGGQSDFEYVEFRISGDVKLKTMGDLNYRLNSGSFIRTTDLRPIENRYFRSSDKGFFSNPTNTLQLIDTILSTTNRFIQLNAIHHFNGFFLNKIWLLNRLKLEESIGSGFLSIPKSNFIQMEIFFGIERRIKIKKQLFKIGIYAISATSSQFKYRNELKIGINFYDSFKGKWFY